MKNHHLILFFLITYIWTLNPISDLNAQKIPGKESNESFNLVIYGRNLSLDEINLQLKTNPGSGEVWTTISKEDKKVWKSQNRRLLVIENLSMKKYFGQDIRENYIAIRLKTKAKKYPPEVSAFYALSPEMEIDRSNAARLIKQIENQPMKVTDRALASHIRPRPYVLQTGGAFTEHIEAPVRLFKPGVREVEWLEILFRKQ